MTMLYGRLVRPSLRDIQSLNMLISIGLAS